MFELLLQADKSMSDGLFDQAERTYWQLIELDPTNAIAVAGLARISLQRGDERLARTFADRALGMDPDSIAARRVILALDEGRSTPTDPSPPDLQLIGAERLEALSRRHAATQESEETAGATGREKGSVRPLPAEALRERRRAGRLAAAAAAAAAAAREPSHTRHAPHHAMPSGTHLFQPEMLRTPAPDPFSKAEMAAAVAAVDSIDEAFDAPISRMPAADVEAPAEAAPDLEHVLEAVDATEAGGSVALRLAFLSTPVEMPPKPVAPDQQADGASLVAADAPADEARAEADRPAPAVSGEPHEEEPSEADAEVQALLEAVAIVTVDSGQAAVPAGSASGGEVDAEAFEAAGGGPSEEPRDAAAFPLNPREAEAAARKKGLFRRFRGS